MTDAQQQAERPAMDAAVGCGLHSDDPSRGTTEAERWVTTLFESAQALQCYVGTAPVSFESGQVRKAYVRFICNKSFRHAVHLWAEVSRKFCWWLSPIKQKGQKSCRRIRCLGQRRLKILWKMWQTKTSYNAQLHMANQLKHGSWVLAVKPGEAK
jgi:hypothetical protein